MSRFSDAAFKWMSKQRVTEISSNELWAGLQREFPELTTVSSNRKTPRTTMMRDLRKDTRFTVQNREITIVAGATKHP